MARAIPAARRARLPCAEGLDQPIRGRASRNVIRTWSRRPKQSPARRTRARPPAPLRRPREPDVRPVTRADGNRSSSAEPRALPRGRSRRRATPLRPVLHRPQRARHGGGAHAAERRQRTAPSPGRRTPRGTRHGVPLRERAHLDHLRVVDDRSRRRGNRRTPRRRSASSSPPANAVTAPLGSAGRVSDRRRRPGETTSTRHRPRADLFDQRGQRPPARPDERDLLGGRRSQCRAEQFARAVSDHDPLRQDVVGRGDRVAQRRHVRVVVHGASERERRRVDDLRVRRPVPRGAGEIQRGLRTTSRARSSSRRARSSRDTSSGESSSNWR